MMDRWFQFSFNSSNKSRKIHFIQIFFLFNKKRKALIYPLTTRLKFHKIKAINLSKQKAKNEQAIKSTRKTKKRENKQMIE
jgi:hypothetical protein